MDQQDRKTVPLSPLKQAFLAVQEAQAKVDALERERSEPIAIIGIGCSVPGAGESAENFWKLLIDGRVAVRDGVEKRFADVGRKTVLPEAARYAGLLDCIDGFDAHHFGISPREATGMDPQQRLLLETSWQALEDAGIDPFSLYQSSTGVFVGICSHDYAHLQLQDAGAEAANPHFASGIAASVASGRIAYVFGLSGPSLSIDTACSSSLVAVHQACAAIRRGECSMALAGGVNLILSPEFSVAFAEAGMLSPEGVCRTFDDAADGFVRGEGCGVVVLKRFSDAKAAGDRILAVIRGSAVNQDGATSGLTVPNGQAQQDLLRQAHANAAVEAWQVGYVETHGTGTSLGDPIEAEALGNVFHAGKKRERPLLLGAVKANVGHLEAAAGVIGLIKAVLTLRHGVVPGHPHLKRLNQHVRWGELPLEVAQNMQAWPSVDGRKIAGVSAFGFSGTNAHVVLEGVAEEKLFREDDPSMGVLLLSARTTQALKQMAERYIAFLENSASGWNDICYTAGAGRAVFHERLAIVADGKAEAAEHLRDWLAQDVTSKKILRGRARTGLSRDALPVESATDVTAVAEAFVQGAPIDWKTWAEKKKCGRVALPGYPFQRERYWVESATKKNAAGNATGRKLLGSRLLVAGVQAQFETHLSVDGETDWIGEHVISGRTIFPLTGYVELMLEAGAEVFAGRVSLEDLVLHTPLIMDSARTIQAAVDVEANGRSRIRIYALDEAGQWQNVSEGWIRPASDELPAGLDIDAIRKRAEATDVAKFYEEVRESGVTFGPRFLGLTRLWQGVDEALGEVTARDAEEGYIFAPWRLDACLQLIGAVRRDEETYLPASIGKAQIFDVPDETCLSHMRCRRVDNSTLAVDVVIMRTDGTILANLQEMVFRRLVHPEKDISTWFYRVAWKSQELAVSTSSTVKNVAVLGDTELARNAVELFRKAGVVVKTQLDSSIVEVCTVLHFAKPQENADLEPGQVTEQLKESVLKQLQAAQLLLQENAGEKKLRLYVITRNGCAVQETDEAVRLSSAPLAGMAHAIALEAPEFYCTVVDVADDTAVTVRGVVNEVLAGTSDLRVAYRSGRRYTAHIHRAPQAGVQNDSRTVKKLSLGTGIEGLHYETAQREDINPDEVEIAVHATALNFRDVLKATGLLDHVGPIGTDCAGVITRVGTAVSNFQAGDAVVAIAPGCFSSHVVTAAALAVHKPRGLSFEAAAAQTVAYLTADYCLLEVAKIRKGERVLIHAAAGGVGLAAVYLCKRAGAEIYATAGSEEKRAWLRALGIEHVYDSRSLEFKDQIVGGVDVVLNSLTKGAVDAGLSLLRPNGRFIELGKTDIRDAASIRQSWSNVTYVAADLTPLFHVRDSWVSEHMTMLLHSIAVGDLPALPVTVFEERETKQAFRHMAAARHIGRVVIRAAAKDVANGTHLITGGLRGVGLKLAEWLVAKGARNLVLCGRTHPSEESAKVIAGLKARGVSIRFVYGDIADFKIARHAVAESGSELRGVWHCAGVLDDAVLAEQSWERFAAVMRPKVDGAWNLHQLTRDAKLDFFVMFSSWASLAGSRAQANYCAANAFLDGLAAFRQTEGLPVLSVNWGAWGETGMAANEITQQHLARSGMQIMDPKDAFSALEAALQTGESQVGIAPIEWPKYLGRIPASQQNFYIQLADETGANGREKSKLRSSVAEIRSDAKLGAILVETTPSRRMVAIQQAVMDAVRGALDLRASDEIDPEESLSDMGMDSLLAVELRNGLTSVFARRLPSTLVFDYPTVQKITRFLYREIFPSEGGDDAIDSANDLGSLSILDEIEQLSDDDVDLIFQKGAQR